MNRSPITLRAGSSTFEEGLEFARYLDTAAEGFFRFMLGRQAASVVATAYTRPDNDYSFQNVSFAEQDGVVVGMISGYTAEQRRGFSAHPWQSAEGYRAGRTRAVAFLCAPLLKVLETIADGDFYLQAIAVDDHARGKGVGSVLMDFVEESARAGGSSRLCLDVSAKNEGARRLYEHRGMIVESQWPKRLIIPGFRLLRMTKAL